MVQQTKDMQRYVAEGHASLVMRCRESQSMGGASNFATLAVTCCVSVTFCLSKLPRNLHQQTTRTGLG